MVWTCEDNVRGSGPSYELPEWYQGCDYRMRPRDKWGNVDEWFRHVVEPATPLSADHAVLGLKRSASQEEIRQAYRAKARSSHPDKGGDHDEFIRIQKAYENLKIS
eukprot:COSAG04_NODE_399_length_14959_cov_28.238730_6_plen_106_part_00